MKISATENDDRRIWTPDLLIALLNKIKAYGEKNDYEDIEIREIETAWPFEGEKNDRIDVMIHYHKAGKCY